MSRSILKKGAQPGYRKHPRELVSEDRVDEVERFYPAERALRPYGIPRKIGFFSQSYRGDRFRPLILFITETCKCLRVGVFQILSRASEQGLRGEAVTVRLPIPDTRPELPPPCIGGVNG